MRAEAKSDFFLSKRSKAKARFQRNNFISIQRFNCKNIFAVFGKSIKFLYNKFLSTESVYLFKCFYGIYLKEFAMKKLFIFALLLTVCINLYGQKQPEWIENPSKVYDKNIYEVGVGQGLSEKEAEDNAYSVLANIFGMKISVDTKANEKYIETSLGVEEIRSLDNSTKIEAEHNLINVKIDSRYYDSKKNRYYAIAVLNKKETISLLNKKIKDNIKIIDSYILKAGSERDLFDKYYSLYIAYIFSEKNENFINQLSILDNLAKMDILDSYRIESIKSNMENIKRKISFGIDAFDITPNIESAIEHSISDLGFKISSNPSYTFRDKFTFDGNDTGYGMYIMNYTLILELVNHNGERIASFKFRGKDGGSSEKDAKRVIMNKLAKDINLNLSSQISNYLEGKFKNIKY